MIRQGNENLQKSTANQGGGSSNMLAIENRSGGAFGDYREESPIAAFGGKQ